MGPETDQSIALDIEKYRSGAETFEDKNNRNANALKDDDKHFHILREITGAMRYLFAGRIQAAMGSLRDITAFICVWYNRR